MPRALAALLIWTATALVPPAPHTRRLEPLSATLTVYSTLGCPHCQRCKKALDAAGLAYDVVDVADAAARAALEARCGLPTVPQVYLDDERVGGADDTLKALADGWLLERDIARVEPKKQVEKADAIAVFIEAPPGGPLNAPVDGRAEEPLEGDVAARLQRSALELIDAHVTLDGGHHERFASWEWRDEYRMELEIREAIERDGGLHGPRLSLLERLLPCCFG